MTDLGHPSRRDVLGRGALLGAAALVPGAAASMAAGLAAPRYATERVLLVVFGGGVRTRETLESGNVPNLKRMAAEGVVMPSVEVRNNGHYGAAVSILTGSYEVFGIREDARPDKPTLFEQVRRSTGLPASAVWLSTSGSDQETNYAYSGHADYGSRYGANLIGGEGVFNAEFRELVTGGRPLQRLDAGQQQTLEALRGALRTPLPVTGRDGIGNDPAAAARIESYILDELTGGTSSISGLGANDAKAMHVARNLLSIFRPTLMAVTLRDADVAHGSFNDYVTVVKRNDDELGKLMDAVRGDPTLAATTSVFVLPEFGRDRDFNARRGLDHGDDSKELHEVSLVAWGPDFKRGAVERRTVRSIDVCPTIVTLLGGRPASNTGSLLSALFA